MLSGTGDQDTPLMFLGWPSLQLALALWTVPGEGPALRCLRARPGLRPEGLFTRVGSRRALQQTPVSFGTCAHLGSLGTS